MSHMGTQQGQDDMLDMAMDYLRMTGVPIDKVLHDIRTMSLDELAEEYSNKESEGNAMGGPPNPGTPADRRKKVNNPNAGKPKTIKAPTKVTKAIPPMKKAKP
jgi:hypothetical protein